MEEKLKKCIACNSIKPYSHFSKDRSRTHGLYVYCKLCASKKGKKAYDPKKDRNRKLIAIYGIDIVKYQEMYDNQNGKCLICCKDFKLLCVDHNHKTNQVRELLCRVCNGILGRVGENSQTLRNAADYLDKWNKEKKDI